MLSYPKAKIAKENYQFMVEVSSKVSIMHICFITTYAKELALPNTIS